MTRFCRRFFLTVLALGLFSLVAFAAGSYYLDGSITPLPQMLKDVDIAAIDEPAVKVDNGGMLFMKDSTVTHQLITIAVTGAVQATTGSQIDISNVQIATEGTLVSAGPPAVVYGANGVFATDAGSIITLNNVDVYCGTYAARGIYTQSGGTIIANNVNVETHKGGGGAAAATSGANGGTIVINGGTYTTYAGMGSAAVYSTGNIIANNATLTANVAEGACVEGPYSITLNNSELSALANNGISFAKSPLTGTIPDGTSHFTMKGGKLYSSGNLFYCPNSYANIELQNVKVSTDSGILVTTTYSGGGPGNDPARGSFVNFTAKCQILTGDMVCDIDSKIMIALDKSLLKGAINNANSGGIVTLKLSKTSVWKVTADSYITVLKDVKLSSINCPKGITVYYDSEANEWLCGKTYKLCGGGMLTPY